MTLSDVATVGSIVGSLAVALSLIYLGVQTRQNSKHTRALLQQGQADRVVTTLMAMANPDLSAAWIAGNGGAASPAEVKSVQFAQMCNAIVYDMSDFYNQNVEGLAAGEQYAHACVGYSVLLQQPGMRAYWEAWRTARIDIAPKFIAWVDGLAAKPGSGSNPNWI